MLDASAASSALHVKLSRWHQASTLTPNGGAGAGVLVALGTGISGRVPLTEIHDGLALNALEGLRAGQAVRASVLQPADKSGRAKKAGRHQLLLSLRPLKGGAVGGFKRLKAAAGLQSDITIPTSMKAANLSANAQVGTRSLHVPHTRTRTRTRTFTRTLTLLVPNCKYHALPHLLMSRCRATPAVLSLYAP